jgi:ABC-type bacteriocin/lantibiotic exporter with double-glycine peptidase domain
MTNQRSKKQKKKKKEKKKKKDAAGFISRLRERARVIRKLFALSLITNLL